MILLVSVYYLGRWHSCLGNLILIFTEKRKNWIWQKTKKKKNSWEKKIEKETIDNKHGTINLYFETFNTFFMVEEPFFKTFKKGK